MLACTVHSFYCSMLTYIRAYSDTVFSRAGSLFLLVHPPPSLSLSLCTAFGGWSRTNPLSENSFPRSETADGSPLPSLVFGDRTPAATPLEIADY
jgi:hypothetical protein